MALSRVKVWSAGEILYALDLNSEFNNILNNGLSLVSPLTTSLNAGGFKITNYGGTDAPTSVTDVALNAFVQSGIGATTQTLQNRMRLEVWVEDFGAVGDGVTNDTVAIQAAITHVGIAGGIVRFSAKSYKVTSLLVDQGIYLVGQGAMKRTSGVIFGTRIVGTAGSDIITFPNGNVTDFSVQGIKFSGGRRHIYWNPADVTAALTNFWLEDIHFSAPSAECIYIGGQSERQFFKYLYFANGTYGYYHGIGSRVSGIIEKSTWEHIYFEGQSEDAVFFDTINNSGSTHFNYVKIISCQKHAWHFKGNYGGMVWTVPMFENCAQGSSANNTTGSITSGTNTLTVASGTGLVDGGPISIRAAAANGEDLNTTISSGGGTVNLVLAVNAGATVSGELVTNRAYDLFFFDGVGGMGNASNITLIGGFLTDAVTSKVRYLINNTQGWVTEILLLGVSGAQGGSAAPMVYDPRFKVTAVASPIGIRTAYSGVRPIFQRGETSSFPNGRLSSTTAEYTPTLIGAPRGKDCAVFLDDTLSNGTGTMGDFLVYSSFATPTAVFRVDGDAGFIAARGMVRAGNFGGGTGASLSEGTQGIAFGNAAPTAGTWSQGDTVFKSNATVGQPVGWRCTVAGSPGTWVAMANL